MGCCSERVGAAISTAEELRVSMGESYALSPQQWEAVTAPLGPAVVIAGAGSGKTTLMKARVVYLVANGLVAPSEILGLTFTTKAAAELRTRVREALLSAGLAVAGEEDELSLPTVTTYNAYASRLLTEHGLRIGHEPEARVMADATRYQLAARAVARHRQPVRLLSDHPATSSAVCWRSTANSTSIWQTSTSFGASTSASPNASGPSSTRER